MELLHCDLIHVQGRAYRNYTAAGGGRQLGGYDQEDEDDSYMPQFAEEEEEEADDGSIAQEGGQFVFKMDVDVELLPFIIGIKGRTKQRIEQDTGARLLIPRKDAGPASGSSQVVIRGDSRASVARARTQTELVVSTALSGNRLEYNYFLSLPLATDATRAALDGLKQRVLAEPWAAAAGIEGSVFMKSAHLHLTLAMLKLYSEERRERARQVLHLLQPAVRELLGGSPLRVELRGLEYMNDDPSQMHVMYLGVKDPKEDAGALQRLRQLCTAAVSAVSEAGLLLPQDERDVKLHATVLNTRYRRQAEQQQQQHGRHRSERQPFDGRQLLQRYGGVDLGVVTLSALHLSQRGKYGQDGYYHCADRLALTP